MPDTYLSAQRESVAVHKADGFVVVSWWTDKGVPVPPYPGHYSYEWYATSAEALDQYAEYERGEYERATPVGIFAALHGMPVGSKIPV